MNSQFPRTLSLLRQEKNISQRIAATELGVSQAVLSHYENGVREPGLDFVVRCADYYGVSSDFLLGRTMSREDFSITADELPDISNDKDNVLRGSMLATLNKKLIVNSLGIIYDILGKSGSKQLINEASSYFSIPIYKVFRHLFNANGKGNDSFFSIPDIASSNAADAEMKLCEMKISCITAGKLLPSMDEEQSLTLPEISHEFLDNEYPDLLQSLLSVLHSVGKKLSRHI